MGDDSRTVKDAGKPAHEQREHTMHGTSAEWKLMSGTGALINQDASKEPLTGNRPDNSRPGGHQSGGRRP